ncbi:MAG: STAS domain-containing protein [Halospina sp.]
MSEESANTVALGSQVDISMAGMLYQQLSSALDADAPPILDGTDTQRIDTAGVQLLLAFRRQAEMQGRDWQWRNRPACLAEAESLLGIETA